MEHKEGENKKDFEQCLDIVVSVKFLKRALIEIQTPMDSEIQKRKIENIMIL